jgi:hypothetical protein
MLCRLHLSKYPFTHLCWSDSEFFMHIFKLWHHFQLAIRQCLVNSRLFYLVLTTSFLLTINWKTNLLRKIKSLFFFCFGKKSDHKSTMLNMPELWHAGFSLAPSPPHCTRYITIACKFLFFFTGSSFFWFSIKCYMLLSFVQVHEVWLLTF